MTAENKEWKWKSRDLLKSAIPFGRYKIKDHRPNLSVIDLIKSRTFIISFVLILLLIGAFFLSPGITGLFISKEGLFAYDRTLDWKIDSDSAYDFEIDEHPETFDLKTFRLSGSYTGNGTVSAYLETGDGTRFLIFDSRAIAEKELSGITAMFVAEERMPEEAEPDYEISEIEEAEEELEEQEDVEEEEIAEETAEEIVEETIEENITEEVEPEENITEEVIEELNITQEPEENISIEIIETQENVIEEVIENITEEIEEVNATIELNETEELNITDVNITEEINLTETNITLNVTDENITLNITTNITINATRENITLNATDLNITETNITNITEATENITEIIEIVNETITNVTEIINKTLPELNTTLETYRNVELLDAQFSHEWKGSWGKLKEIVLSVDNQENQSIWIKYVTLDIEGYDEQAVFELDDLVEIEVGESGITLPVYFTYAGDNSRKVRIRIKDETTLAIASRTFTFNPKEAEQVRKIDFANICVETCLLPSGLNSTEYSIIFEVDSGLLEIDNVNYILHNTTTPFNASVLESFYAKVKEDPRYDAVIDSTVYDNVTDELTVIFHHDSPGPIPILIKGKDLDYDLTHNLSSGGENVTLIVYNWNNRRFRILVGEHTEAFEFGVAEELTMTAEIKDSKGEKVNATIELIDSLTDEVKTEKTILETQEIIEEGEYDIKINFEEDHPIKEIVIEDVEVYDDLTELIKVEDTSENLTEFIEVYAIDPTSFNFTNATVTVVATGTSLYKCKDWNFTTQECISESVNCTMHETEDGILEACDYTNGWEYVMDVIPGQEYTFTLTPEDPGFGEIGFDDVSSATTSGATNTLSWSHTISGGSNRLLTVGCAVEDATSADTDITSVTYNSQALNKANDTVSGTTYYINVELWYLLEGNLPSAGTYTVQVTTAGSSEDITCGAISLENVSQSSPEATATNADGQAGWDYINTQTTTKTSGAWVVDVVGSGNALSGYTNQTSGQTERWDLVSLSSRGAGSTKLISTAGQTWMNWTTGTSSNRIAHVVAAFAPIAQYEIASYETGVIQNVNGWTMVNLDTTYTNPVVIVTGQDGADTSMDVEASRPIIANVSSNSFQVIVINDQLETVTEDVGYIVMEKGHYIVDGVEVEAGTYTVSSISSQVISFNQTFPSNTVVVDTIQENTVEPVTSRYTENSMGASSYTVYWEEFNTANAWGPGSVTAGYLAVELGSLNSTFESGIYDECSADPNAGTWCTVSFSNSYSSAPILFTNPVDSGGGDTTVMGRRSLSTTGVDLRPTEDRVTDTEQAHATNDLPWIVWTDVDNRDANATVTISLFNPATNANFTKNAFNEFTVNVSCTGNDCDEINITLDPEQSGIYPVSANNRDAWDDGISGDINKNYFGDLDWSDAGGYQFALPISQNSTITSAYLSVYANANIGSDGAYTARIRVEDAANASVFTGAINNIYSRTYWGTTVDWSIPSGGLAAASWHNSTDISDLVQHIVNRTDWSSGNYISIAVWGQTGNGGSHESTVDYNDNPSNAPKLYVTWTEGETKGIVPTVIGSTPFYTNKSTNPFTINLSDGASQLVTFWINATGDANNSHEFFAYANLTSNSSISNITGKINITIIEITCTENWTSQYTSCNTSDKKVRYYTDVNACGTANDLPVDNGSVEVCNYCSEDITGPFNTTCLATDNLTQYYVDDNYTACCALTGIVSDCGLDNNASYANQTLACDNCTPNMANTSWSNWYDITICQINDTITQQRNNTQYDLNYCGEVANTTNFETQGVACNYCSYSITNTSWASWTNQSTCLVDDSQMQNRSREEYDQNYPSCYAITNLASDLWNSGNNNTYWEYQYIACDYCTPSLTNTSWTAWINLTCIGDNMNQTRNLTQYDSNICGEITNTTYYDSQLIGPTYQNTSWTSWLNMSCLASDTMNQSKNLTQYDQYSCATNITFVEYQNMTFCDYCTPNMANTSWSNWYDITSCQINDTITQQRNNTQYDLNYCGEIGNTTNFETQGLACNYCSYSITNTSLTPWTNQSTCLVNDSQLQNRSKIEYDQDYPSCYAVTSLPSDLWNSGNNNTYWEYQYIECDYCSYSSTYASWTAWQNDSSCMINDLQQQNRSREEYDQNYQSCYDVTGIASDLWNSGNNNTEWDYKFIACDYCTPIWTAANISCNTSDNKTQYYTDSNGCYSITHLPSDNSIPANTTFSCDYCSYNITNTSWSEWQNQGTCLVNDSQLQSRSKTEYDSNYQVCSAVTDLPSDLWNSGNNNTYLEYQYIACDYCIPGWKEINQSCSQNDTVNAWYNDSNDCFAQTGLILDNNPPANTAYSCDYVVSTEFDSRTTNFSEVTLSTIDNLVLEVSAYGMINFTEIISINQSINLDSYIEIANNSISINSTALARFNKSAILTLYNLSFINPIILKDGVECGASECARISYTNSTLVFNVTHFTTYSSSEGPYCGDNVCAGDETCSSCVADCGACSSPSSGGGGGSKSYQCNDNKDNDGDGLKDFPSDPGCISKYDDDETNEEECVEYWSCSEWYGCVEGIQARTCVDINACGTEDYRPKEKQECIPEDSLIPEEQNLTKAVELIETGMITGKPIKVLPQNAPNPFYLVPTILLLILLIALLALRKTKLSKKMKKIVTALHVTLLVIISVLLFASFVNTKITGFSVESRGVISNIASIFSTTQSNMASLVISILIVILSITALVLIQIRWASLRDSKTRGRKK